MSFTRVKTNQEIANMRISGSILRSVLETLKAKTVAGVSTKELDDLAFSEIKALGAIPSSLGYMGFPASICISLNDEVVHGIPTIEKVISYGDIVSLDLLVSYNSMITDAAISFVVGKSNSKKDKLLQVTESSLAEGVSVLKSGVKTGDIGYAIEKYVNKYGFGIVRDLVGHGVGHNIHEDPNIPNYGRRGKGEELLAGMTVAIEPMITMGGYNVSIDDDGWTVRTRDSSLSAHFEHTVLVTEDSFEILTM